MRYVTSLAKTRTPSPASAVLEAMGLVDRCPAVTIPVNGWFGKLMKFTSAFIQFVGSPAADHQTVRDCLEATQSRFRHTARYSPIGEGLCPSVVCATLTVGDVPPPSELVAVISVIRAAPQFSRNVQTTGVPGNAPPVQ